MLEEEFDAADAADDVAADEGIEELDPFAGLSDEEIDALCEQGDGAGIAGSPESLADGLPGDSLLPISPVEPGFKSGFVALVGRPNAGKSTLLNACMGQKVAITSPVAQTTRRRLRAVVNRPGCQLVIVDTPGLHKPKDGLGAELNKTALGEISDVDVIALVVDASAPFGRGDAWVARHVAEARARKVLVLTKADRANQQVLQAQMTAASELVDFDDVVVTSSTEGFNVEAFVEVVSRLLPEGPRWFPEGMDTDESDEMMVAEFVREKVLLRTQEEVPHAVGVVCDSIEHGKRGLLRLHATIYVEREGQKGILVGKRGEMIRQIGTDARLDLEQALGHRVFLQLEVRVRPNWRESARDIRAFGYAADDE